MSMVAMAGSVSGATVRTQKRVWGLCTGCSVGLVAGRGTAAHQAWGQLGDSPAVPPRGHRARSPESLREQRGGPGIPKDVGTTGGSCNTSVGTGWPWVSPDGHLQWELEHLGGSPKYVSTTDGSRSTLAGTWVVLETR